MPDQLSRGERMRHVVVPGDRLDPRGFPRLVAEFSDSMLTRNYALHTAELHELYLSQLATWLEERGVARPQDVTRPMLQRWQRHLYHHRSTTGRPLSFMAQYQRLSSARLFFRFLARQNHILYNPASDLDLPKLERRLPRWVLTHQEAERVLAQPQLSDPLGVRDRAILETFYATGIRRFELAGLSVYDLDAERGTLLVRQGKGKKDRLVPIGERAVGWIERYLAEVRPLFAVEPDAGVLFLGAGGEDIGLHRLSELVREYVDSADVGKRGSCHLFRHSMATLMLEGGADIRFIQQMLGHARIASTELYTKVSIRQLQRVYAATHPAALAEHRRIAPDGGGDAPPATPAELMATLAAEAAEEEGSLAS
jgi:integrase/recombinase XerD